MSICADPDHRDEGLWGADGECIMCDFQPDIEPDEVEDVPPLTLTAADRCDRCGAQAFVITQHDDARLLWCAHHYTEHEEKLSPAKVLDRRGLLLTGAVNGR